MSARYRETLDPLRSERRVELVTLALGGLLLAVAVVLVLRHLLSGLPEPIEPAFAAGGSDQAYAYASLTTEEAAEIIQRPLFWQSRRPEDPVTEEAVTKPAEQPRSPLKGIRLVGVFGGGEAGGAILVEKGEKRRVLVGEAINGWTLKSVEPDGVTLTGRGQVEVLQLIPQTGSQPSKSGK